MNMKRIHLFLLLVTFFLDYHSYAQNNNSESVLLQGKVVNSKTNIPEAFASIYLYPQKVTTFSDTHGRFYIESKYYETTVIVVRMIGFWEYKRILYPKDYTSELIIRIIPKTKIISVY